VPYRKVTATKGKVARAEPVAALYEQGRVAHVRGLSTLEDQMCLMTTGGFAGSGSPDRVDALVWALHELMIGPAQGWHAPRMRSL
jgi:phage terminase large subunit-like protein